MDSELNTALVGKGLTASSISTYLKNVARLNDDKPYKNLNFLSDVDGILKRLDKYKDNTKRSYLISIVSVLGVAKTDNKKLTKLYDQYHDEMMLINAKIKAEPANVKSDTQAENWMDWSAITDKYNAIKQQVLSSVGKKKEVGEAEYNAILEMLILSLYINIPPRRNQDYTECEIVSNKDDIETPTNHLVLSDKSFIFNKYKTAKTHGIQVEAITAPLWADIVFYIRFHPLIKSKSLKKIVSPFLVNYDGSVFKPNSITRILNKIFGKKIGSSMLRHIFLTDKFGDTLNEMESVADAMAHTISTQKDYIKNKTP